MPDTKKTGKKRILIDEEAEVDGSDTADVMEQLTEREMVDLTNWTNDSPSVSRAAHSHQSLEASRRKKACKAKPVPSISTAKSNTESEGEEEEENNQDREKGPEHETRSELLHKLQEAKKEEKAIEVSAVLCATLR